MKHEDRMFLITVFPLLPANGDGERLRRAIGDMLQNEAWRIIHAARLALKVGKLRLKNIEENNNASIE